MPPEELRTAYSASRLTPQRREIASAVGSMPGSFTAAELSTRLRDSGASAGLATVYRALAALEASGWIARAGERGGAAVYTRCSLGGHHHHLVCTGCGKVAHAPCPVQEVLPDVADATGFVITGHDITLYGVCSECGNQGGTR